MGKAILPIALIGGTLLTAGALAPAAAGAGAAGAGAGYTGFGTMANTALSAVPTMAPAPSLLSTIGTGLSNSLSGIGNLFSGMTPMQGMAMGGLGSTLLSGMMQDTPQQPEYGQLTPLSGTGVGGPANKAIGDVDPFGAKLASLQEDPKNQTNGNTLG